MSSRNSKKSNAPASPIVDKKESAEEAAMKSPEPDRIGMLLQSVDFLRSEFLDMKSRIITIETKTDKDSNPSGYATPDSAQGLGALLREGLDTQIPQSPKKGSNRGSKKQDDTDNKHPSSPAVPKKVQQQNNHRKSLAALERDRVVVEPVVVAAATKDERQVMIKQLSSFKGQLRSLDGWSEFYNEVTKFQMINETKIYAGAYVSSELLEELIEKNQLAKDGGRTFMADVAKAVDIYNCNLVQLEELVKIAIGPKTLVEYETELKKFVSTIFKPPATEKNLPRIYRFEDFSRAVASYIKHFNQRLTLLSGTDQILPMFATKQKDGHDGSVQIFLSALPQNYCTYLRQYMTEVKPEDDDIIQFVERFRKAHIKKGYNMYNDAKPLAEALVKDYPDTSRTFVPKSIISNSSTSYKSPARPVPKQLHSMPEQQELNIEGWDQLAPDDPESKDQSLFEDEDCSDVLEEQLNALTAPQKTLYDPGTPAKKSSTGRGCFNVIMFGTCKYEGKGCYNLHDAVSVKKSAEVLYETVGKFLGKKST
jgi:hypothetical protein